MTKLTTDLPFPPTWIDGYVTAELLKYGDIGVSDSQTIGPIVRVGSGTNIDELYANLTQNGSVSEPLLIISDRMMVFRPNSFYPQKREQIIYYMYSADPTNVWKASQIISQLLDREDASAQDLNEWCRGKAGHNVFFRNTKVYEVQASRDLIDYATAKVTMVNKLIIEYDWHAIHNKLPNGSPDPDNNYL
jgi:hypothetical protein